MGRRPSHRSEPGLQAAVVAFDPVVLVLAGVVKRSRNQVLDHVRQRRNPVGGDLGRGTVNGQGGNEERPRGGDVATLRDIHVDHLAVRQARVRASRVVNTELLTLYRDLGTAILDRQETKRWGTAVIDRPAVDLRAAFLEMRRLSRSDQKYMRQLAGSWPRTTIDQHTVGQLPWGISQSVLRCGAGA